MCVFCPIRASERICDSLLISSHIIILVPNLTQPVELCHEKSYPTVQRRAPACSSRGPIRGRVGPTRLSLLACATHLAEDERHPEPQLTSRGNLHPAAVCTVCAAHTQQAAGAINTLRGTPNQTPTHNDGSSCQFQTWDVGVLRDLAGERFYRVENQVYASR